MDFGGFERLALATDLPDRGFEGELVRAAHRGQSMDVGVQFQHIGATAHAPKETQRSITVVPDDSSTASAIQRASSTPPMLGTASPTKQAKRHAGKELANGAAVPAGLI